MQNRGKQFEKRVKEGFERLENTVTLRLHDDMSGYSSVRNPCDFLIYQYPKLCMLECKSCHKKSLPLANITEFQHDSLLAYDKLRGIIAGYMIWYIDLDLTIFIRATTLEDYIEQGMKSINPEKLIDDDYIIMTGKKKRVMFDYDFSEFFNQI